jgi:hypothetical protein
MASVIRVQPNIKPKFWHDQNVKGYQNFPGTSKTYPIFWDFQAHKYKFDGLSDDDVKSLALKAKLSYVDGADEGKIITEVDLYHREDPFFNHPKLKIKIQDDVLSFNINNPIDKLKLAALKAYPEVASNTTDVKNTPNAKWIIIDEEIESKNEETIFKQELEIAKYFVPGDMYLSPTLMREILIAFNDSQIRITPETTNDFIAKELYKKATDKTGKSGDKTNQARFLQFVNMDKTDRALHVFASNAKRLGVLTVKGDKWFYGGNELANSLIDLIKKLKSADYQFTYENIESELNDKIKAEIAIDNTIVKAKDKK